MEVKQDGNAFNDERISCVWFSYSRSKVHDEVLQFFSVVTLHYIFIS
jgi:hypothetical protein